MRALCYAGLPTGLGCGSCIGNVPRCGEADGRNRGKNWQREGPPVAPPPRSSLLLDHQPPLLRRDPPTPPPSSPPTAAKTARAGSREVAPDQVQPASRLAFSLQSTAAGTRGCTCSCTFSCAAAGREKPPERGGGRETAGRRACRGRALARIANTPASGTQNSRFRPSPRSRGDRA